VVGVAEGGLQLREYVRGLGEMGYVMSGKYIRNERRSRRKEVISCGKI
jgi:hypothetical protein